MGTSQTHEANRDGTRGPGSRRFVGTIIALVFLIMGGRGLIRSGGEERLNSGTYSWVQVPCRIIASAPEFPEDPESNYRLDISYRYAVDGTEYISDRYAVDDLTSDRFEPIQRALIEFPLGAQAACFVNPSAPADAILHRQPKSITVITLLLDIVFVAIGLAILPAVWWRRGKGQAAPSASGAGKGIWARRMGYGASLLVGGVMLTVFTIPTIRTAISARSWTQVPATIVVSRVQSRDNGNRGKIYSPDILHRYEFQGRSYLSNWYSLGDGLLRTHSAQQRIIDRMPPGMATVAFVNPADPVQAVLDRSIGWNNLLDLFSVTFVAIGVVGSLHAWKMNSAAGDVSSTVSTSTDGVRFNSGPHRAKLAQEAAVFAVIWNSVAWAGVLGMAGLNNLISIPGLFFDILALLGLLVAVGAIRHILCLFNPAVEVSVTPRILRAGNAVHLRWTFTGRAERIAHLRITIVGREPQGIRTERRQLPKTLVNHVAVDTTNAAEIAHGEIESLIPDDIDEGSDADAEPIHWSIVVHGKIRRWPDVRDQFAVAPGAPAPSP